MAMTTPILVDSRQQCDFTFSELLVVLLQQLLLQFHWKSVAGARGVCAMQFAISLAQNGDRIVTVCNYFDLFFLPATVPVLVVPAWH